MAIWHRKWMYMTLGACAILACVLAYDLYGDPSPCASAESDASDLPVISLCGVDDVPQSFSPLLHWSKNTQAVVYEMEIFTHKPLCTPAGAPSKEAAYRTRQIYMNYFNPPLRQIAGNDLGRMPLYWRVRALGFDGEPVSAFSELAALYTSSEVPDMDAPFPLAVYNDGPGTTLLYPVYSWAPQQGAASFVVELYTENPEEVASAKPVQELRTESSEVYDPEPRIGTYYWRVHAYNAQQEPIGAWSEVQSFRTEPEDHWQIAVLGDSISHGGGHYSFSPADFEFSWLHYLHFDAVNLSQSGDTSQSTLERFDRDVLPFHPQYLIIFTGTNSLRAGEDPQAVIDDLEEIRRKALANGIKPILMTLPPINPAAIQHVFEEETAPDWLWRFQAVNAYIRRQVHIDAALPFRTRDGSLDSHIALDGLHPDVVGKRIIGETVNSAWPRVRRLADEER